MVIKVRHINFILRKIKTIRPRKRTISQKKISKINFLYPEWPLPAVFFIFGFYKVSKVAKIRNRYNQVPHLTQDTNGKVTNS